MRRSWLVTPALVAAVAARAFVDDVLSAEGAKVLTEAGFAGP